MKRLIVLTALVCGVLVSAGVFAGTVTEYIRIYGYDGNDSNSYFKGESDELISWSCGVTPSGGPKSCYKFVGAPDNIWEVRVHMYRDDGGQYGATNWWYWQQDSYEWDGNTFVTGGYFDTNVDLEGYWGYRDGHHTYRGEHSGGGCPWCSLGGDYYWYFPDVNCSMCFYSYPIMGVNYFHPEDPLRVYDRYFYVGAHHRQL